MTETSNNGDTKVILGPLANDLPFMIRNLHAMLRPVGASVREPLDIETGSIGILSLIWVNPGISQNDLAANLAMKKSAVAKVVKKLEEGGLLDRTRVAGDRRMNAITLTLKGHQMIARIRRMTVALNDNITKDIPDDQCEIFFHVLEKLHQTLSAHQSDAVLDRED